MSAIAFTVLGYSLSWLELAGVLTGLAAVSLAAMGKVINFYIGLVNNVLYFIIFYQNQLYSMMLLQVVFFSLCCYGIYSWSKPNEQQKKLKISLLKVHWRIVIGIIIIVAGLLWARLVVYFSELFPENIETPACPNIDALLTMASIAGQALLTRKKLENWALWMMIDASSTVFYATLGLYFTAILYSVYFCIGTRAFFRWRKEYLLQTENRQQQIIC